MRYILIALVLVFILILYLVCVKSEKKEEYDDTDDWYIGPGATKEDYINY